MRAYGANAAALVWRVGRRALKTADGERYGTFAQCCDDPFLFAGRSSFFRSSSDSFHSHARPPITHSRTTGIGRSTMRWLSNCGGDRAGQSPPYLENAQ